MLLTDIDYQFVFVDISRSIAGVIFGADYPAKSVPMVMRELASQSVVFSQSALPERPPDLDAAAAAGVGAAEGTAVANPPLSHHQPVRVLYLSHFPSGLPRDSQEHEVVEYIQRVFPR